MPTWSLTSNLFPARKDQPNNTVGYREASVGDPRSELSRVPAQKAFMDSATFVLGKNTFKYLVTAERSWKAGVAFAKSTIFIKSVVVPLAKVGSNFLQPMHQGMPDRNIAKDMTAKLA